MTVHVLVTGGAGFLGSHLCDALVERGDRVTCLDDLSTGRAENVAHLRGEPRFTFVEHDVTAALPDVGRPDWIINFASPASPIAYQRDPIRTLTVNVLGALHGLELAQRCGARFLQASTSEVYGDPEVHPQPETYRGHVSTTGPRACYDEGKRAAETLATDFARHHGVEVRIARIFNTYGPRMRADDGRVVSTFITQALAGEPLTLYGQGKQTRSFCYVADLIEGLMRLLADDAPNTPVNLGNPSEISVAELAVLVLELCGVPGAFVYRELPADDPARRQPDISLAKTALRWQPRTTLREGLEKTIAAFRLSGASAPRRTRE
jgi:UDP-glucuronate decarboxylase